MKKTLLAVALAAGTLFSALALPAAATAAPQPERIRGTVTAVAGPRVTVRTTAGGTVSLALGSNTKYLFVLPSSLKRIEAGSYIGTAAKTVGGQLIALEVVVFPPAMRGAGEGHYPWDRLPDTTVGGGMRTASTMTNGTVAAVAPAQTVATAATTMTNGTISAAKASGGVEHLTVTYQGGKQNILVPPTAPIVTFAPAAASDVKAGAVVFVNATADNGKLVADRVVIGSHGVNPPM